MRRSVLVLNCGSSSVKFSVFDGQENVLIEGMVQNIGQKDSAYRYRCEGKKFERKKTIGTNEEALEWVFDILEVQGFLEHPKNLRVGHRVVHGGDIYPASVPLDAEVKENIARLSEMAPLHNPLNLEGIEICEKKLKGVVQIAVFDTSFHQTIPEENYLYAIPKDFFTNHKVRKYGFHGISHHYLKDEAARILKKKPEEVNLVTCHLGNGCSLCAIKRGKSFDTSMGFTPLDGLIMGTRSGSLDAGVVLYLSQALGLGGRQIADILNKRSGLLALSGSSADMREIESEAAQGNSAAELAFKKFCDAVRKFLGGYLFSLEEVDGIVFSGGIGENSPKVREQICGGLQAFGIELNASENLRKPLRGEIGTCNGGKGKILVIPANEELMIAREVGKYS